MKFLSILFPLFVTFATAAPPQSFANLVQRATPTPFSDFTNNLVFYPNRNYTSWKVIYARTVQLPDGSHLLSWENYPPEPPQANFPIYKSTDGGANWIEFSSVSDQVNGWGLRYQPNFYLLKEAFGGYPAGTILLGGASVPADLSEAYLDLYASRDGGLNWEFVSHMVYGAGPETTTNGNDAVWEPFFMMHESEFVCFFSDQRDENHAQKLAHITTKDLKIWSEPVDDVASSAYEDRPGMTTVAHIQPTGQYIITYEVCATNEGCEGYYKVSSSPLTFGTIEGRGDKIVSTEGHTTGGSPYVIWTPNEKKNDGSGIIIMNGASREQLFVNEDSADPAGWKEVDVGQWAAHSRCIEVINNNGTEKLMLSNAGQMQAGFDNYVVVGVVDIPYDAV
ncbi:bnr asp-box repeat domain protein [Colletotrichum kahawae]|uniref:Bnr asp-box repeat domain protein n=1 Tax=Colletotrichum kahawae TaxID=34407 RepID=A0AAD9YAU8_COLKA|nr:bnr asp-box repeat domain protein [Colletotrichum kahawae]